MKWKNLAPRLVRQRCIIELDTEHVISEEEIKDYLQKLSRVVGMTILQQPFSYPAVVKDFLVGYGGWIHWATSGAHAYSYIPEWTKTGKPFFTVDAYTCKPFSLEKAVKFTKKYFKATEIVWKEVEI
ncbi:MAG: S-adenosylmethionine decarboxylase [Candidatus Pacebacteria bacterium]|nr:S-adenosylmethionine decarboxylase [Candidatus Paceibacterota bacterium]